MRCPDCQENGKVLGFFPIDSQGRLKSLVEEFVCPRCDGTTEVPDETPEWMRIGREMKQCRIDKGITLRKASIQLEINPCQLSSMERGCICPLPHLYDKL